MELDILEIDQKIKENFAKEVSNIDSYRIELEKIKSILQSVSTLKTSTRIDLQGKIQDLNSKISDIENNRILNYYILDSVEILEDYKNLIKN